jgi:hypothetical protein
MIFIVIAAIFCLFFYLNNEYVVKGVYESIIVFIGFVLLFSILFISLDIYNPLFVAGGVFIVSIILAVKAVQKERTHKQIFDKDVLMVLALSGLLAPFIVIDYEYLTFNADAGTYSNMALHLMAKGSLMVDDSLRDTLSSSMKSAYDTYNHLHYSPGNNFGSHLPGLYIEHISPAKTLYEYQFYSTWPSLMTFWGSIFGVNSMYKITDILFLMNIFLSYHILNNFVEQRLYTFAGTALLITSPVFVYFSNYPTSEFLSLFLFLSSMYFLTKRGAFSLYFSILLIILFMFNHISAFMYFPILLLVAICNFNNLEKKYWIYLLFSSVGFFMSLYYGYTLSNHYFEDVINMSFKRIFIEHPFTYGIALSIISPLLLIPLSLSRIVKEIK